MMQKKTTVLETRSRVLCIFVKKVTAASKMKHDNNSEKIIVRIQN